MSPFRLCLASVLGCLVTPLGLLGETLPAGHDKANPGRILARYVNPVSAAAGDATLKASGVKVRRHSGLVPGLVVLETAPASATPKAGKPSPAAEQQALFRRIATLKASGLFAYVEPDYRVHTMLAPNDAAYGDGRLWGLNNAGQQGGSPGADINAAAAWDLTTGSTNVIVAVIDTGIRYTHVDLVAQMWRNPGEIAGNGIDDDGDGYVDNVHGINSITGSGDPMDDHNHGSHVSGTIGAAANNGQPHVGVTWQVQLMGCKFLDSSGSGNLSDAIECIDFAVANGAKILNNSWGGGGFSQALLDSITNARDHGVLFVAAAGNEANNNDAGPSYPASYEVDNMVAVAALDRADALANFSNYGKKTVHLGAPGVEIFSSIAGSDTDYAYFSGTSMATPHVVGVAALIMAQFPDATLSEVRQRLLLGTTAIGSLQEKTITGGRLNAHGSLSIAADGVLEISVFTPSGSTLPAGATAPIYVKVTDLLAVTNATVSGTVSTGGALVFANAGMPPDEEAVDNIYTSSVVVPTNLTSLSFTIVAAAPGKQTQTNTVVFPIQFPPANDAFASRTPIDPATPVIYGDNLKATTEAGEPSHAGLGGGKSVWWKWRAPATGNVTFTTSGSSFDTILAVYTGSAVNALTPVAANDDVAFGVFHSQVTFAVIGGTEYQIAVDGYGGSTGAITLSWILNPAITNDHYADRTSINGLDQMLNASNYGATRQAGESVHAGVTGGSSVWWTWQAPRHGYVTISTAGSAIDTLLAVYRGPSFDSLFPVPDGSNDNAHPLYVATSQVTFFAIAGNIYEIAVDGKGGAQGRLVLTVVAPPANDAFSNALELKGLFAESVAYNLGATHESGEPHNIGPAPDGTPISGSSSVWWWWTAPADGNVFVTTAGSNYDTTLGIYTGNSVNSLTEVTSNDDVQSGIIRYSQVNFRATGGVTYRISVDGWNLASGALGSEPLADSGSIALSLTVDGASRLSAPLRLASGDFQFLLTGDPNRSYVIEASADLLGWLPIRTNLLSGKSLVFIEAASTLNHGLRFYRAVPQQLINAR